MDDYANQIASDSQRKESSPELDSAPVPLVRRAVRSSLVLTNLPFEADINLV